MPTAQFAQDGSPPAWVRDAVFYQVFPDRFRRSLRVQQPGPLEDWDAPPTVHGFKGGDLLGVAEGLEYIADLGATAIYLNPIFASASNHRYHTYDYLKVDPLLGGDDALRELLDAAHLRGMRVVLDGVFNHASRGFWPFHHVLEAGAASPYREWFYLNDAQLAAGRPLRAYRDEALVGPPEVDWADAHRAGTESIEALGYRAWWDLPALPKLNIGNPQAREYLLGVAEHWIRFGADGWRLDVPEEIDDMDFWAELRRRVRIIDPEAYLVGEIWRVAPDWLGAGGFDSLMNYPLTWAIVGYAAGRHLDESVAAEHSHVRSVLHPLDGPRFVASLEALLGAYPPAHTAAQLNLLGSHDTPRVMTLCGGDEAAVRIAMLLMLALPGAPSIYYGDEIGLPGRSDPDCRRAFPWDESVWNRSLRSFVRAGLAVRAGEAALRGDGYRTLAAEGMACAFERVDAATRAMVAVNAGDAPAMLTFSTSAVPILGRALLATGDGEPGWAAASDGRAVVEIPARWGGIWRSA
ncbi:MAG: glycoside hydrolase family 13 protein [Chloroflexota bacterium]